MNKINFKTNSLLDGKEIAGPIATDDKYLLLSLFVGQFRFPDNIQEIIDLLESVRSGNKTWLEANDDLMFMQIGYMCGDFKCDKDMAYFIADNHNSTSYQNLEMPLQEVIDLMKDWKIFMG